MGRQGRKEQDVIDTIEDKVKRWKRQRVQEASDRLCHWQQTGEWPK